MSRLYTLTWPLSQVVSRSWSPSRVRRKVMAGNPGVSKSPDAMSWRRDRCAASGSPSSPADDPAVYNVGQAAKLQDTGRRPLTSAPARTCAAARATGPVRAVLRCPASKADRYHLGSRASDANPIQHCRDEATLGAPAPCSLPPLTLLATAGCCSPSAGHSPSPGGDNNPPLRGN